MKNFWEPKNISRSARSARRILSFRRSVKTDRITLVWYKLNVSFIVVKGVWDWLIDSFFAITVTKNFNTHEKVSIHENKFYFHSGENSDHNLT